MDRPTSSNSQTTEALRVLRERYRATSANTVAAFRRLATQLAAAPTAPELVATLRRELHRVHGSAGSYGFPEASTLAGALEELAIRWMDDPSLDRDRRASMIEDFAGALEAQFAGLPAAPPRFATPPRSSARTTRTAPAHTDVPDLVVVEDDPGFMDMLRFALGTTQYAFQHYATGPEALEALLVLDTAGTRPVVLLDVDLPGLDGFSLHERLRLERPGVYVTVFLTARGGEAEQLRAYRAGAIDYMSKPVNLRILMAKIPSWLSRAGHAE